MPLYVRREASKLWRKICAEMSIEIPILAESWKYLLGGLVFQYIHGLAARGVHYLHRPGPILQDIGFLFIPELGRDKGYISETLFTCIFCSFTLVAFCTAFNLTQEVIVHLGFYKPRQMFFFPPTNVDLYKWTFHPFICQNKKIYTVLMWCRVLAYLVASQVLRIVTFYSTQLPGPNYHCREGSELATLPPPRSLLEVAFLNFPRGILYGCGDLIFSSHMIFTLVFVNTYQKHGTKRFIKQFAWLLAVVQSLLIIASRKHYTVDIVVAWYTVNLLVFCLDRKLPEMPDRSMAATYSPPLPLSTKDKESKSRGEQYNLLNGVIVSIAD